ncbi:hypothetical protein RJ55_04772 [Drechmeria coniospora]|nr:hypothetical protein RJ55_04772 [Drechmeria coniospora]
MPPQNYRRLAEMKKNQVGEREANRERQRISDARYWAHEADMFRDMLHHHQSTLSQQSNSPQAIRVWKRSVAVYRKQRLSLGHSPQQIKQRRLMILSQDYWRVEAEALTRLASSDPPRSRRPPLRLESVTGRVSDGTRSRRRRRPDEADVETSTSTRDGA